MTIPEARKLLTHKEMEKLTETALATGQFSIQKVWRKSGRVEVLVKFPETGRTKLIEVA